MSFQCIRSVHYDTAYLANDDPTAAAGNAAARTTVLQQGRQRTARGLLRSTSARYLPHIAAIRRTRTPCHADVREFRSVHGRAMLRGK